MGTWRASQQLLITRTCEFLPDSGRRRQGGQDGAALGPEPVGTVPSPLAALPVALRLCPPPRWHAGS